MNVIRMYIQGCAKFGLETSSSLPNRVLQPGLRFFLVLRRVTSTPWHSERKRDAMR